MIEAMIMVGASLGLFAFGVMVGADRKEKQIYKELEARLPKPLNVTEMAAKIKEETGQAPMIVGNVDKPVYNESYGDPEVMRYLDTQYVRKTGE